MQKLNRTFNRSFVRTWLPIILGMITGCTLSWLHVSDITNCDLEDESVIGSDFSNFNAFSQNFDDEKDEILAEDFEETDGDFEPVIITDPDKKPVVDVEANKAKIVRPRYISTELGIREKLFTAVISQSSTIGNLASGINKTLSGHLDKVVFYTENMSAEERNQHNLEGMSITSHEKVGGGPDKDVNMLHQTLLDLFDKYIDIYDWFFIFYDRTYVQPERVLETVNHMSITRLLYMGQPMDTAIVTSINEGESDNKADAYAEKTIAGKYCKKEAGFFLSRALLLELVPKISDCQATITSRNPDVWLGQCILSLTAGKIGQVLI